jgi:hypothetical protein
MIKKVLSYFFIVFGLVVLWASTSRTAMEYVSTHRESEKWWGAYPCLHGDLVSMSYLDIVKRFNPPVDKTPIRRPAYNVPKNTVLYLHGDSYSRHLSDSDFAGVQTYIPIDRNHGINYHLDSTKNNILLIEVSERYFRAYFAGLQIFDEVCDSVIKKKTLAVGPFAYGPSYYAAGMGNLHFNEFFNKYINQNLQCNLFNYNFVMPMFQSKAALNYYVFNRASGDVVISKDRNFLFLKETVTLTDVNSSYSPLPAEDVQKLVDNLNAISDHYRSTGFKEVYISVIPNPATIMQPQGYNNLLPLVQQHPQRRFKIIDAYTAFKNSTEVLYLPGDTHWNNKGRQLWLDLVNKELVQNSVAR